MIRRCADGDSEVVWTIINDGAQTYEGVIPAINGQNRICRGRKCGARLMMVWCSGDLKMPGN